MAYRKFMNDPETLTAEMLEGLALVMADYIDVEENRVVRKGFDEEAPKTTILTIGGTGHEPSSMGFCGRGWECIKVLGDIFAAPGPAAVLDGIHRADKGRGVLMYIGNHAGDVMSAKMAAKRAMREGVDVRMVIFSDDISSFPREQKEQRRGMVLSLMLGRILGAASEAGYTLDELGALAEKIKENAGSISAATRSATHPQTGQRLAKIEEGKVVVGMGQHGEGSGLICDVPTSREMVRIMADRIIEDISLGTGDAVAVTINGTGATTYMELMILFKDTVQYLASLGIETRFQIVGEYLTTQEQAGFQMSLLRLDDELERLAKAPCRTAFMTRV